MSGDWVTIQPQKKNDKERPEKFDAIASLRTGFCFPSHLSYKKYYPAIPSVLDRSLMSTNTMFPHFFWLAHISLASPPRLRSFSAFFDHDRRRVGTNGKKREGWRYLPNMGVAAQNLYKNRALSKNANTLKMNEKEQLPSASNSPKRPLAALVPVSSFLPNFKILVPFPGPPESRKQKT